MFKVVPNKKERASGKVPHILQKRTAEYTIKEE